MVDECVVNLPAVGVTLESLKLRLDEAAHFVLPCLSPGLDEVDVLTTAVVRRARVSAVVASADAIAVESGGAVGHGAGPLADDRPLVRARVYVCVIADVLTVLPRLHSDEIIAEARVFVVVYNYPLCIVVRRSQEAVERVRVLEAVVEHEDTRLGELALVAVSIAVVLASDFRVEGWIERLIEGFDRCNSVVIIGVRVSLLDLTKDGECAVNRVSLLPTRFRDLLARIIESVL